MIKRIWRGWTTEDDAPAYEKLLRDVILPGIKAREIKGYLGGEIWRRKEGGGVIGFMTVLTFETVEDLVEFVGEDYKRAHVPDEAKGLLLRWDERSEHYLWVADDVSTI